MTSYHIPDNEQPMDELYAVISKDGKGEGIVAMMTPAGNTPLVFGHKRMLDMLKPMIQNMVRETGRELFIVKYKKFEVLETIELEP